MYIPQRQLENIEKFLQPGKVVVLYGARRVGKTTLIEKLQERLQERERILLVNGDDIVVRQSLESQSISQLRDFVGQHSLLIVDEAQYIANIGQNLKLIVDHIPGLKVVATGSSSFDLARDFGEPLTGRKYVFRLFPLAQLEISTIEKRHETLANLENRLIYGSYPEIVTMPDNRMRQNYLREIVSSYLFKDILAFEGIRYSNKLTRLLQLLAFQVGKQCALNELGKQLGMSKNTIERYLDLLERAFVIYRVSGFSRNLRKELSKSNRYYFFDTGLRNALIGNFNPLTIRDDIGQIWENYVVTERLKKREYHRSYANAYFWRTYDKTEIDLVEERDGRLFGYEVKWQKTSAKAPKAWLEGYPKAAFEVINRDNYLDFIL